MGPSRLVTITRADPSHRGADRITTSPFFEHGFLGRVPWKHDVGAIADQQVSVDTTIEADNPVEFLKECSRIDHDAAGDNRFDAGPEYPGRQKRELVGLATELNGVPRVVAPLVSDNDVVVFGQQVDDLALGLVAPLKTNHGSGRHGVAIRSIRVNSCGGGSR